MVGAEDYPPMFLLERAKENICLYYESIYDNRQKKKKDPSPPFLPIFIVDNLPNLLYGVNNYLPLVDELS